MGTHVKNKVSAHPIEKLLKDNQLLPTDSTTIHESVCRLQELRKAYIEHPETGKNVLSLPERHNRK